MTKPPRKTYIKQPKLGKRGLYKTVRKRYFPKHSYSLQSQAAADIKLWARENQWKPEGRRKRRRPRMRRAVEAEASAIGHSW